MILFAIFLHKRLSPYCIKSLLFGLACGGKGGEGGRGDHHIPESPATETSWARKAWEGDRELVAVRVYSIHLWLLPRYTHPVPLSPLPTDRCLCLGTEDLRMQPHSWFLGQQGLKRNKLGCSLHLLPTLFVIENPGGGRGGAGHLLAFSIQIVFRSLTPPSPRVSPLSLSFYFLTMSCSVQSSQDPAHRRCVVNTPGDAFVARALSPLLTSPCPHLRCSRN